MLKVKKAGEKKKQNMKMKNTVYSIQFPVFIPYLYGEKKGTQFFASLFLPHCEVDRYYSIRGTILAIKGSGEDNGNNVPKCIKNHLPRNWTEEPTGYSRADFGSRCSGTLPWNITGNLYGPHYLQGYHIPT